MKTDNQNQHTRAGLLRALWKTGWVAAITLPALLPADPGSTGGKDYAIFVGTEIAVRDAKGRHQVVGAEGNAVLVRQKDSPRRVSLDDGQGFEYERGIKLSSLFAEVGELKATFSNQAANQAWFDASSAQIAMQSSASEQRDRAIGQVTRASSVAVPLGDDLDGTRARARAYVTAELARMEGEMISTMETVTQTEQAANMYGEKNRLDDARRGADTVTVTFRLSSPKPLGAGFVALITEYRAGGPNGTVQHGVSVEEFGKLDAKPRKFTMRQNTLPGAWERIEHRVAVFADGQEVATNLSERRTDVNREEAHQFFLLQYLLAHKGQTRGPSTIPMMPLQQLQAAARNVELPKEIFVKVDKTGNLLSLSGDRQGGSKVPPACEEFLENFRFLPALENGQPVEGSARLALADILR